jgi:hypothetical protein
MTRDGAVFPAPPATIQTVNLDTNFADFRLDTLYLASYSDAVQAAPPDYRGSLLAHGWVDDIHLSMPAPPQLVLTGHWTGNQWAVSFLSTPGWSYWLERSENAAQWVPVSALVPGTGDLQMLSDTNPPPTCASYRVATIRP